MIIAETLHNKLLSDVYLQRAEFKYRPAADRAKLFNIEQLLLCYVTTKFNQ
jgi:hypothetical protein